MKKNIILLFSLIGFIQQMSANNDAQQKSSAHYFSTDTTTWIRLEFISEDSLELRLNGWFMTNGGCSSNTPLINMHRKENNKWENFYCSWVQMDCGLPFVS